MAVILVGFCFSARSQGQISFRTIDEVYIYADAHSSVFKNATQENILSKYQTLAAKMAIWNLKSDVNFSATDNTKLATTFIPAEIFGGPAGTFQKVTFGQPYISNINITPQIDILNLYAIAKVKLSKANEQLTKYNNLLTKKNLYESLAATFCNILSYQWQIIITKNSFLNADTLTQIMQSKLNEGIARSQDVNNATANKLAIEDKLQQLQIQLTGQLNALKSLCDIDTGVAVNIEDHVYAKQPFDHLLQAQGNLDEQKQEWQKRYQQADLNASKKWFLPTVTLFSSFAFQQNTSNRFFDNSPWFASNYVGIRVTFPLVPDVTKWLAVKNARINLIIADDNLQHARLQENVDNAQLQLDYQKADNSYGLALQIEILKKDSYRKNLNIYKEGILSATDLLNSLNEWLNASLNTASQLAAGAYAKAKININNTVK